MNKEKIFEKNLNALKTLEYSAAIKKAKELLNEASQNKNREDQALALYMCGLLSRFNDKHYKAMLYYNKALKIFSKLSSEWFIASVNHAIGHCYNLQGKGITAIPYYEKSYNYYVNTKNLPKQAMLLINLGVVYGITGENDKGLQCYIRASDIFKKLKMDFNYALSLNNIAMVYKVLQDNPASLKYLRESTKIFLKLGDKEKIAGNYSSLGDAYLISGDLSKAEKYCKLGYQLRRENMLSDITITIHLNLGRIYLKQKKFRLAEEHLTQTLSEAVRRGNKLRELQTYKSLGELYLLLGKFAESERAYYKALALSQKLNNPNEMYETHAELSRLYNKSGDFKKALHHYTQFHKIYIKTFNEHSDKRIKELKVTFEKEKAEHEAEILTLKNLNLKKEIEAKTKELSTSANYILSKNEFLNSVISGMKEFISKDSSLSAQKQKLFVYFESIERKKQLSKELVHFEQNLNKMNLSFTEKLSRKFPSLTRVELKICSLIKINLGTKEIAKLLSLSLRTVESHRYHITQKLKLSKGKNLTQFIQSF